MNQVEAKKKSVELIVLHCDIHIWMLWKLWTSHDGMCILQNVELFSGDFILECARVVLDCFFNFFFWFSCGMSILCKFCFRRDGKVEPSGTKGDYYTGCLSHKVFSFRFINLRMEQDISFSSDLDLRFLHTIHYSSDAPLPFMGVRCYIEDFFNLIFLMICGYSAQLGSEPRTFKSAWINTFEWHVKFPLNFVLPLVLAKLNINASVFSSMTLFLIWSRLTLLSVRDVLHWVGYVSSFKCVSFCSPIPTLFNLYDEYIYHTGALERFRLYL